MSLKREMWGAGLITVGSGTKRETVKSVMVFLGQVPAELENKASAVRGQEAERASTGAGHQVRRELKQGWCRRGVRGKCLGMELTP